MRITGEDMFVAFLDVLGLPARTIRFTVRGEVGGPLIVDCEYYPQAATGHVVSAMAEYVLVPKNSGGGDL